MSYDISFKVKVEGVNEYLTVGDCTANITYNVRDIIVKSTGLSWNNESNNGYCKHVIPKIIIGYNNLINNPQEYKKYESHNGWGTVGGTIRFFKDIIDAWEDLVKYHNSIAEVATFWIT